MSRPAIVRGSYISIAVEDADNPGTFLALCGLNTKNFVYQKNSSDEFIADCADPEDVPVRALNITGRQWDISGDGYHNRTQAGLLRDLMDEGSSRTFRFVMAEPAADAIDDGYWEGPAQLMNLNIGAGTGRATSAVAIASDGEWVWNDA